MLTVKLRKGKTKRIKQRHLWIFRGDLNEKIPRGIPAGPVLVEDHAGRFACIGDYDPGSNIAVRVLSWKKLIKIDEEFFRKRILKAYEYRKVRIMKISGQSPDHPVCLSVPETNYLKAVFAMVIE